MQELGLVGSQVDINGSLSSDKLRLFAQAYVGAFIALQSDLGSGYQSGSLDLANLTLFLIPLPQRWAVWRISISLLRHRRSSSIPMAMEAATIRYVPEWCFSPSSSVQPFDGSQQGEMVIAGRQTVIESADGVSPLANTTLVQFTPYLGGGIYNDLISFSTSSSSSSGSTHPP